MRRRNDLAGLLRVHLRPYRGRIALLIVLQLVQSAALLYLPTVSADIIDNGVLKGDTDHILRQGGWMIAFTIVQVVCLVGAVRLGWYTAMAVGRDLRGVVFERVLDFSAREMGGLGVPSLITRTVNDVQQIQTMVSTGLTLLVTAPVMGVGGVLLALGQDVPLAVLLLVLVPLLSGLMLLIIRAVRPLQRIAQRCTDDVGRVLREQVAGARVIRAFTRDGYERERFAHVNGELTGVSARSGRLTTMMLPLAVTVTNLFSVSVVWLGAYRVESGAMQIGALTAFLGYLALIVVAVITATFTLMALPRAEVGAERVAEVLRTPLGVVEPERPVDVLPAPGHLELRDVRFTRPGAQEPVLKGITFTARPGTTTALIGSTGSGKSTLVELAVRLADVDAGQVLVGGVDVRELSRSTLVREISLVPQSSGLFAGTVASNLRLGRPDATDDELWWALEVAQAKRFVEELDGGLAAPVSAKGAGLSGGQRQRLAIARALVVRPRIHVFDDAFSALDHETDARLRAQVAAELSDATIVVVSQRIATIRDADQIVVLEAGEVAGIGVHDELLAGNEVYREIVQSQLVEELA